MLKWLLLVALSWPALGQASLLPLDDRPCNLLFVRQIARIAGHQLAVPPRAWLGNGYTPGRPEPLRQWLLRSPARIAFVSTDMLCYGGLVASRTAASSLEEARSRLEVLRTLHQRGVRLQLLATLPRLSLRTSEAQAPYERALAVWAAHPEGKPDVPSEIVDEYLAVRRRNFELLLALLPLVEEGSVEKLAIGQDDSAPEGLHHEEQLKLHAEIASRHLEGKVVLISGADELSMDLVAGWLARRYGLSPKVRVEYNDPEAAQRIPPLESLPLQQMVEEHLALCNCRPVESGEDVLLLVEAPFDRPFATPGPEQLPGIEAFAARVTRALAEGRSVALADLALVNRMDPYLAEALIRTAPVWRLEGFAGWNTSANAFGTTVAQLVAWRLAGRLAPGWTLDQRLESAQTQQSFLLARLVDDYRYQSVVRGQLRPRAQGLPLIPDPLLNPVGPFGLEARLDLIAWADELFRSHFLGQRVPLPGGGQAELTGLKLEVVLPWPRLFEVEVRLQAVLSSIGTTCRP